MANDKLSLYNDALNMMGERTLASLNENREPRRVLDVNWPKAVKYCLEQGQWKFALRTSKLTFSPNVNPAFGYRHAFERPDDCVRTAKMCTDEYLNVPLLSYGEEAGWWFADLEEIFTSYVSDHVDFGNDLGNWPETFTKYVATHLASESALRITQSEKMVLKLEKDLKTAKKNALSKDALQGPTQFLPQGTWVGSRQGDRRGDRGSRSRLIG
jgi:hypothetical protein